MAVTSLSHLFDVLLGSVSMHVDTNHKLVKLKEAQSPVKARASLHVQFLWDESESELHVTDVGHMA